MVDVLLLIVFANRDIGEAQWASCHQVQFDAYAALSKAHAPYDSACFISSRTSNHADVTGTADACSKRNTPHTFSTFKICARSPAPIRRRENCHGGAAAEGGVRRSAGAHARSHAGRHVQVRIGGRPSCGLCDTYIVTQ